MSWVKSYAEQVEAQKNAQSSSDSGGNTVTQNGKVYYSGNSIVSAYQSYVRKKKYAEDIAPVASRVISRAQNKKDKEEENEEEKKRTVGSSYLTGGSSLTSPPYAAGLQAKEEIPTTTPKEDDRKWFQKGALEDGVSWENVFKTILGSTADFAEDLTTGIVGVGEKAIDGLLTIAPYVYKSNAIQNGGYMTLDQQELVDDVFTESQEDLGEFIKKDLYDENAVAKQILSNVYAGAEISNIAQNGGQITQEHLDRRAEAEKEALEYMITSMEPDSVFAEKSDSLIQSAGQMAAQKGLTLVDVPWFLTTGLTSAGSQMEQALNEGATFNQGAGSALISAGADILSEKLFSGDFFVKGAAVDKVTPYLATAISDKTLRALAKFGIDTAGEGIEEVFSEFIGRLGTALYKEENLAEILFNEEALDSYLDSAIGGLVLGGTMNSVNAVQAKSQGADFTTGLPKAVDSAVDDIYNSLVADLEHYREVSPKEKRQIYAKVLEAFSNPGDVDTNTETVEETVAPEPEIESAVEEAQPVTPQTEATVSEMETDDIDFTEEQIADLEQLLEELRAKRQAIQDEITNEPDDGFRSELLRRHEHDQYYLRSEILETEAKLDALKNPTAQSESSDVAPVVTDEDVIRFSEDSANIVSQMVTEDSQAGEQAGSEPQKVYSIDGYTVRRVVQKTSTGGERYLINVVSPDGFYRLLHTDKDINSFYGAVSDALGQLMAEEYSVNGNTLQTDEAPLGESVSEVAPVAEEFTAPVVGSSETETTTDAEIQQLQDERQVLQDTIMSRVEVGQVDETTEMLAKKWNAADSKIRAAEAGKTDSQKPQTVKDKIQDKDRRINFSFEKLFHADNPTNRERYNAVLEGTKFAQDFISKGAEGVKSVSDIFSQIKGRDLYDFNDYLYHLLNVDRTTLDVRFGKENRPVFGEEGIDADGNRYIKSYVTAEESQKIVDDLEAKHPEFKAIAEEVYAYCDYLLRLRVDSGALTQEQYDSWREMYPHYVPISRTRWATTVSEDLVKYLNEHGDAAPESDLDGTLGELEEAAKVHNVYAVGDDLRFAMDSMVDLSFRSFWDASLVPIEARPNAQSDIAPVAEASAPITNTVTEEAPIAETVEEAPVAETVKTPEASPQVETPVTPKPSFDQSTSEGTRMLDLVEKHTKSPKKGVGQKILDAWHTVQEFVLDKGLVFERIAKKHNNRQLEADWDFIRRSPSIAQEIIARGSVKDGVRSLATIHKEVQNAGFEQDFSDYLGHLRNLDGMTQYSRYGISNQSFMGREASVAMSSEEISRLETAHPEFKQLAEDVYAYNNYLINQMVQHGVITQEAADMWHEMYPHYVPMRTSGGKNIPVLESMAQFTLQAQYAIAMNDFGRNLNNTLHPDADYSVDDMDITAFFNCLDAGGNAFNLEGGDQPKFTIYQDGYETTFDITEDMYVALKPTSDFFSLSIPGLAEANDLRRNLITAYNPWFTLKNAVKDAQEILINSQHPLETYATIKTAIQEIYTEGEWFREYMDNGGGSNTYFNMEKSEFGVGYDVKSIAENYTPLKYILQANNIVEMVPRLSEYIASRQAGRSVQVSMLDAARVTTNFGAGGDLTKLLNRNGVTFLNASVQGFTQHVRNIHEAAHAGAKGWTGLAARYVAAGLPAILLNNLIWDDDEDYQALPDYISNNYYVVWKYGDGKFIRIPKGRTAAVMQFAMEKVINSSDGDDEADWKEFLKLFAENIAPNNPATDNMFAPILQVAKNTSWYGEDIVPTRLQDLPKEEQFDEKTDELSIQIGDYFGISPKKVNYLLDQYGGVLGDTFLPMGTPKAESPIDNPAQKLFAPLRDIFTTDSVLNNKVTGEFYETLESLEAKAKTEGATLEDKLKSGLMIGYNVEISKLMQEQRDIQTSDLPDSKKYIRNREIKEEINELQKKGLEALEDYRIDGNYAESGGKRYNYDAEDDTWWEVKPKLADGRDNFYYIEEQLFHDKLGVSYEDYWNGRLNPDDYDIKSLYGEYNGKRYNFDMEKNSWFEIQPKTKEGEDNYFYQKEQQAHELWGVSYEDFWNNREGYIDAIYVASNGVDFGYGEPFYETVKSAIGLDTFTQIASGMTDISADLNANGQPINGSRKRKMKEYIYSLDIPDIQKHILFRAEYPSDRSHARQIVQYLDENNDISYDAFYKILDELGYKVNSKGGVSW